MAKEIDERTMAHRVEVARQQMRTGTRRRKTRKDKKPAAVKMGHHLTVKMTPGDRERLRAQAKAAGYKSAAYYLRDFATKDRARLGLAAHDYNANIS